MDKCIYCGSQDLVKGIATGETNSVRSMGLKHGILAGTEPLLADLCKSCGSVTRLWVKNPNRDWVV